MSSMTSNASEVLKKLSDVVDEHGDGEVILIENEDIQDHERFNAWSIGGVETRFCANNKPMFVLLPMGHRDLSQIDHKEN